MVTDRKALQAYLRLHWIQPHGEREMTKNVGGIDRILRIVVGLALIALALLDIIGVWGWIGIVPLATGAIGWCPAYLPLGIKTCKSE